jgi:hypothetical protein
MTDEKYSAESNDGFGFRSRPYQPPGHVDVSAGTEMPDGILSMKPLAKGATMTERAAVGNAEPLKITPELKTRLTTMNPEIAQRVRAVVSRKP